MQHLLTRASYVGAYAHGLRPWQGCGFEQGVDRPCHMQNPIYETTMKITRWYQDLGRSTAETPLVGLKRRLLTPHSVTPRTTERDIRYDVLLRQYCILEALFFGTRQSVAVLFLDGSHSKAPSATLAPLNGPE